MNQLGSNSTNDGAQMSESARRLNLHLLARSCSHRSIERRLRRNSMLQHLQPTQAPTHPLEHPVYTSTDNISVQQSKLHRSRAEMPLEGVHTG